MKFPDATSRLYESTESAIYELLTFSAIYELLTFSPQLFFLSMHMN
jgi:hypothetical protein